MDKARKASLEVCGTTKTRDLPGCNSSSKDLLSVPPHIQSSGSGSLLHMDLFSEGSDSEYDTKSRSSGLEMELLESPGVMDLNGHSLDRVGAVSVKGDEPDGAEEDLDYPILCGGNIKDYINDLTIISHAALIGNNRSIDKVFDKEPLKSESPTLSDANVCMSTYEKWKRLSGPMALFVVIGLIFLIWGRGHFFQLVEWLEKLPLCYSLLVFITLFTIVSFPFGFGYIVLNMMAGYLYGFFRGQLIVMLSVSVGISVSFILCRLWFKDYARSVVTSNALQAVLKVLDGPQGFKVIFLTRFTPIPFGFQNVLFSMTTISYLKFLLASALGLFPTQLLNTYMGSTVRNMQEVLAERVDGYIILGLQIIVSIFLTLYILNKARRELAKITRNMDVESGNVDDR